MQLEITKNRHHYNPYWSNPIPDWFLAKLQPEDLDLFDQNGYDMTTAEQCFALYNSHVPQNHRKRYTNKLEWMVDLDMSSSGPHLNHCDLYQRRGFSGEALQQVRELATKWPIYHKLSRMRPKWGVDISVDYADKDGNVFELLHFEWDDFNLPVVLDKKTVVEQLVSDIDWDSKAKEMLERKNEWHHLDFFGQSDWKQQFWGLPKEQFKEVIWD